MTQSAVQTLVLVVEQFISKFGDDDGALAQGIADVKAQIATEETEIQSVAARVTALEGASGSAVDLTPINDHLTTLDAEIAALPAPFDPSALEGRVTALEERNAADDAVAAGLPSTAPSGGATPLSIVTTSLPDATVGASYSATVSAVGGVAPYAFSTPNAPDGLSMAGGGSVTGTPTTAASDAFDVTVHDANGASASVSITLNVVAAVEPAPEPAPESAPAP